MATLRDLKRQIGSVKNIAKVTEALQTVSAVKFRKAEARVKKARPYAENVEQMMRDVARSASANTPLLAGREVNTVLVASLTADRGLAGGFNAQILRRTMRFRNEQSANLKQIASGRKSVAFFRFRLHRLLRQPNLRSGTRDRQDPYRPLRGGRSRRGLPDLQPLRDRPHPKARRHPPPPRRSARRRGRGGAVRQRLVHGVRP